MLRRMMFALELRPPTARVKERIWTRQLERHGIEAVPDDVRSLASESDVTPGVAVGAIAAAQISGGDIETVRCGVRSLTRVLSRERPPQRTPAQFDPGLIRADTDPTALADCLADSGERRLSLCLQGAPGDRQERVRPLSCRPPRPGGFAEAGVRFDVDVGRRDGAADCRRFC